MSDNPGADFEVKLVHVSTTRIRTEGPNPEDYAFADDVKPGDDDPEILEDLAQTFKSSVMQGISRTRESLDDLHQSLVLEQPTEQGSASLVSAFVSLFRDSPKTTVAKKLQMVQEAAITLNVLEEVAVQFPEAYNEYRQSVNALNHQLKIHPGYRDFDLALGRVATNKNISPDVVRAMMNDPVIRSPEIMELRNQVSTLIKDPSIQPFFAETEARFVRVDQLMSDTAGGINSLGKKQKLDMTAFHPLSDVAERMATGVDQPLVSRPGGPNMNGENSSLKENMKKIAETVRKIIEQVTEQLKAAFTSAGPSPSISM